MIYISEQDWKKIPTDYKSVWSSDEIHGTRNNGKKTWMKSEKGSSVLLIEGTGFKIVDVINDHYLVECDDCNGEGTIIFDDSEGYTYSERFEKCEKCSGEGQVEVFYENN